MTLNTFNLPDVGEGLTEAEIVRWQVQPGATVAVNDVIVEIETAKSLVELPSPYAGVVAELLVREGETVEVGTPIISVSDTPLDAPGATEPPAAAHVPGELVTPPAAATPSGDTNAPLVGTGPKADSSRRRPRTNRAAGTQTTQPTTTAPGPPAAHVTDVQPPATAPSRTAAAISGVVRRALAKPPVRKAARDLGIDLADVPATGGSGEVTKQDLLSYQAQRDAEQDHAPSFWGAATRPQDQRVERIPVKGVRKATARAMVESAFSAPHVSIFVDVDASRTMEFVKRLKVSRDFEGVKVSPLLILAKAVIWAAARNPSVNATWTDQEILVKHFMNLGIAAATPRGLMVPNIKDAQDLSLKELALALNDLASRARAGKTQPAEMQGGTLTVTNIGALGIDTGTPIINPGEVAIVAFGTIKQKPWVLDGEVIPRWITTLGGSFDHRVVDGDLSARFMADVASILEEPALLLD
ncbi:dihydrolipoamide acetyltransferase family protein [Arthrobacter tumbae]|uniref:dihydrolipoamide acetyltransferase family protein n=1 Tax=Arthrobacter tumbae TaxID=163874 RepID=UPI0019580483|nr:dihydrolipoamide acetyltransferase family protein [Arthrobacter tumbae]MBM7781299.1 pyruvate dehydrogenase E2 component (dihydrolipoamide acetyltransferase) [Arthrobacter tumbae]